MNPFLKLFLFFIAVSSFVGCDQVTKNLAKTYLMNRDAITYFHNTFVLKYVENTGAFLSMGDQLSDSVSLWIFIVLPIVFLIGLLVFVLMKSREMSLIKLLGFALILAGGIGNIIDRILYDRHVTDFMILGIGNLRTGIFNFADLYVSIGAVTLLIFYRDKKNKAKENYEKQSKTKALASWGKPMRGSELGYFA